jgi:hypothetical protein
MVNALSIYLLVVIVKRQFKIIKKCIGNIILIIFFDQFQTRVKKVDYKNGLTIYFKKEDIYIWCDLSADRKTIKKLEFGRLINQAKEQVQNFIKGVFLNDGKYYITFLQTSFDSEYFDKKNNYQIDYDENSVAVISQFLKIPCLLGWTEQEYCLQDDGCYKVVVYSEERKWTIKLMNIGEQDLPLLFDTFDIWLRVKIADAFWYNRRRTVTKIDVNPLKT